MNGTKIAGELAIGQPDTGPAASLAATCDQRGGAASLEPLVAGTGIGDMRATGTGETSNLLLDITYINTQEIGDSDIHLSGVNGTLAGSDTAFDQHLGKWPTPRCTAGTTVGVRKHIVHLIYLGIFKDK